MIDKYLLLMIITASLGTIILRFIPFIIFNNDEKTPQFILWSTKYLPRAVMAMLFIFCLKNISFIDGVKSWLPTLVSVIFTIIVHVKKRNLMLSICSGTILYMILIRIVI